MFKKILLLGLILILTINIVNADLTDAIAYYSFDVDATDDSANSNDGTLSGVTQVSGVLSNAYSFDGVQNTINLSDSADWTWGTGSWSIGGWMLFDEEGPSSGRDGFFGTTSCSTNANCLGFFRDVGSGNRFEFTKATLNNYWTSADIGIGHWRHVLFVQDAGTMAIYINGTQYASNWTSYGSQSFDPAGFRFGKFSGESKWWAGDIDEWGIWTRVLTPAERNQLYNNGAGYNPYNPPIDSSQLTTPNFTPTNPNKTANITVTSTYTHDIGNSSNINITWYINNVLTKTTSKLAVTNNTVVTDWFDCATQNCNAGDQLNVSYRALIDDLTVNNSVIVNYLSENVIINVRNNLTQTILTNVNVTHNGISYTLTGFTLGDFLNTTQTWEENNFTVVDLNYYTQPANVTLNITSTQTEYNITLTPVQLRLTFSDTAEGWYDDINKVWNFSNTSIIVYQQNFGIGKVTSQFGKQGLWQAGNHTQYYEYINDRKTHIVDNITVFNTFLWTDLTGVWIRTLDFANSPIENVDVNAYIGYATSTGTNWSKMGRRLTDNNGYTNFIFDTRASVRLTFSKDGYTLAEQRLVASDIEANTQLTALTINLEKSDTGTENGITIGFGRKFSNRSLDIYGMIYAPSKTSVKYTTQYRIDNSKSNLTATKGTLDDYPFTLIAGRDYSLTGSDDITIYFYIDNEILTRTITYDPTNKTKTFSDWSFANGITGVILFLALIFLSAWMGRTFKYADAGFGTFMVGTVLLSFITTQFLYLSLLTSIYFGGKIIYKIIGD